MLLRTIWRGALLAFLATACFGQTGRPHEYTATCSGTLTAQATACTVQLPASSGRWVLLKGVFLQCSVACVASQERDGTAATTTAVTIRKRNPNASWIVNPTATVFSSSNVGAGTAVGATPISIGASPSFLSLDANGTILERGAAAAQNYTIRLASMTGDYTITFQWEERTTF